MSKTKNKPNKQSITQFVQYLVSGGAYFWSGYLMFFVADQWLDLDLWWAKLIANLTGWTVNYVLQRYWVFNNPKLRNKNTQVTGRYIAITAFNFVLDYVIVRVLKDVGISPYIGQFVSAGFFTGWNYLWYKFWVFKQPAKRKK